MRYVSFPEVENMWRPYVTPRSAFMIFVVWLHYPWELWVTNRLWIITIDGNQDPFDVFSKIKYAPHSDIFAGVHTVFLKTICTKSQVMQLIHACVEPKQSVTFNQYLEWRDEWESTSQESYTTGKLLMSVASKSQDVFSHIVLQLSLPNPLKLSIKSKMKM